MLPSKRQILVQIMHTNIHREQVHQIDCDILLSPSTLFVQIIIRARVYPVHYSVLIASRFFRHLFRQSLHNGRRTIRHSTARIVFVWWKWRLEFLGKSSDGSKFTFDCNRFGLLRCSPYAFVISFHIHRHKPTSQPKHWKVWSTFARSQCVLWKPPTRPSKSMANAMPRPGPIRSTLSSSSTQMPSVPLRFTTFAPKRSQQMDWREFQSHLWPLDSRNVLQWNSMCFCSADTYRVMHRWHPKLSTANAASINCSCKHRTFSIRHFIRTICLTIRRSMCIRLQYIASSTKDLKTIVNRTPQFVWSTIIRTERTGYVHSSKRFLSMDSATCCRRFTESKIKTLPRWEPTWPIGGHYCV